MIEVRFTPTRSEVAGPARAELLRRPAMIALCAVVAAALIAGIAAAEPAVIAGALICVLCVAYLLASVPARAWRQYTEVAGGEVSYRISEDGLAASAAPASSTSAWTAFVGATRTGDVYVLKTQGNRRLMIPARAFTSPDDEQAFRELVAAKIADARL